MRAGLSWWDQCPYKKKHQRLLFSHMNTQLDGNYLQAKKVAVTRIWPYWDPWFPTYNLQNCEKINYYCSSHMIYGILLCQSEKFKTLPTLSFLLYIAEILSVRVGSGSKKAPSVSGSGPFPLAMRLEHTIISFVSEIGCVFFNFMFLNFTFNIILN